ncbi:MAG: response regulator [Candidatus Dormibacteria bacterium]|jgi:DNA-binding response OmpR family regulator
MRPRVLVVEDHHYLGNLLRDVLPQAGFEVELVTDAVGLIGALDTFKPDVVLADFRLRGEDGLDICEAIRAHPRRGTVPVILHTAVDPRNLRLKEAMDLPDVTLLQKPADFETMVGLLRQRLAGPPGDPTQDLPGARTPTLPRRPIST